MTVSVSLIEDDDATRKHLIHILKASLHCNLTGIAINKLEAKKLIEENKTDIFMVDLDLPDNSVLEILSLINEQCPKSQSLVISNYGDSKSIISSICAGASGYLLKQEIGESLTDKIISLKNGMPQISPSLIKYLFETISEAKNSTMFSLNKITIESFELGSREIAVLNLLVKGISIYNIADHMCITTHTVNQHLRSIYKKLGVHSRSKAVYVALNHGLISD